MTDRSILWSIIQQVGAQTTSYLVFIVLSLLLNPKDFGILAMATAWTAFILVFSDVGFSAALIQRKETESKQLNSTFFMNVALGFLLSLFGVVSSWPIASFYKAPALQPIIAVLSIGFLINSFAITQNAMALRELRFKALAIRDIVGSAVGGIVGIVLACLRFGVWSLVAQTLVTGLVRTILVWMLFKWEVRFREVSLECIKDLWAYSSKIFAFNIAKYFTQNSDKLIIGYFLGAIPLGLYTFAYGIAVFPVATVTGPIGTYLFPRFSRIQEDLDEVKRVYLLLMKAMNNLIMPAMVVLAVLAPTGIPLVFGQKWMPATPLIQILIIVSVVQTMMSITGQLMKALNHPGWLLNWTLFFSVLTGVSLWLGVRWGLVGVVTVLSLCYVIALPSIYKITTKLIPVTVSSILRTAFPAVACSLALYLVLQFVLSLGILSNPSRFMLGAFVSLSVYFALLVYLDKEFFALIRRQLSSDERQTPGS